MTSLSPFALAMPKKRVNNVHKLDHSFVVNKWQHCNKTKNTFKMEFKNHNFLTKKNIPKPIFVRFWWKKLSTKAELNVVLSYNFRIVL